MGHETVRLLGCPPALLFRTPPSVAFRRCAAAAAQAPVPRCLSQATTARHISALCLTFDLLQTLDHAFKSVTSCFQTGDIMLLRPMTLGFQDNDVTMSEHTFSDAMLSATSCFQTSDVMLSVQCHHAFRPTPSCSSRDVRCHDCHAPGLPHG